MGGEDSFWDSIESGVFVCEISMKLSHWPWPMNRRAIKKANELSAENSSNATLAWSATEHIVAFV